MQDVIAAARGFVGTPFLHQGRLPGVGLDCAGVIVCALTATGRAVRDVAAYGRLPARGLLVGMVDAQADRIAAADIVAGDILLFRFRSEPQHLAWHTGTGLIHAWADIGRVVEHDMDALWRSRLVGAFRYRGEAHG